VSESDQTSAGVDGEELRGPWTRHRPLLLLAIIAAGIVGGFIGRGLSPAPTRQTASPVRPIVQIVRQQPGLPSLADTIDRLCPSIATIVPMRTAGEQIAAKSKSAASSVVAIPAFAVSADGWLLSSGPLPQGPAEAVFGDGRRSAISEVRSDPVSGLVIAKTDAAGLAPLTFSDQAFARVGDFGFALQTANGSGCSARISMIGSDFLVDGEAQGIFLHLQDGFGSLTPGTALLASDGTIIGVESNAADNALIPAPLAAVIVDELIRNSASPIARFGFRAVDFSTQLAARIANARTRGVGVALIEPGSAADQAGLKAGDVVVAVDTAPISSASELSRNLDAVTGAAALNVVRGTQQLTLTVKPSTKIGQHG